MHTSIENSKNDKGYIT